MKKIVIYIMRLGLSIIYGFLKFFPTQENKVLFLSRQSDEITQDFSDTQELLRQKNPGVKIVTLCHRLEGEKTGNFYRESASKGREKRRTRSLCCIHT